MATIPSIAVIPSGYKASKLYSVLPTDGSGDLDVVRAGLPPNFNATRVNSEGLIENVLSNVPRLDYSDGGCPSLLVEPQITNFLTYSEDFSNAVWSKTSVSIFGGTGSQAVVTSNFATAPNGVLSADRVQLNLNGGNTITDRSGLFRALTVTVGVTTTCSIYIKANTGNPIIRVQTSGTGEEIKDITITNQWQRVDVKLTNPVTTTSSFRIYIIGGLGLSDSADLLIWGAQREDSPYVTSYIPTVASTVTRNADVISKTGISSLINSEEGVLYWEGSASTDLPIPRRSISLSDGTSSNTVEFLYFGSTNAIRISIASAGVLVFSFLSLASQGSNKKMALVWNGTNLKLFVNGSQLGSALTTPSPIGLNKLALTAPSGSNIFEGRIKNLQVYKTALSDLELISLTS